MKALFFDWNKPFLPAAASHLAKSYCTKEAIDCRNIVACVPGARAGRRLLELLVLEADKKALPLFPPRIVTVGAVPELFHTSALPVASPLERALAWTTAFGRLSTDAQMSIAGNCRGTQGIRAQFSFGAYLDRIYAEFSAARKRFEEASHLCLEDSDLYSDKRWQYFAELRDLFLQRLSEIGVSDLHHNRELFLCQTSAHFSFELVLLGCIDLPEIARAFLRHTKVEYQAWIFAPESEAKGFDDFGCLLPLYWKDRQIPLSQEHILFAESPAAEAELALQMVPASTQAHQLSFGIVDESSLPYLQERLAQQNFIAHHSTGRPYTLTSFYQLLAGIERALSTREVPELFSLVRHPELLNYLALATAASSSAILESFDEYQTEHLQFSFEVGLYNAQGLVAETYSALAALFAPFLETEISPTLVATHCVRLALDVCGLEPGDTRLDLLLQTIDQLCTSASSQDLCKNNLAVLQLLLLSLKSLRVAEEPADHTRSVEVLGWLELALDDAAHMVVLGMNEGLVPEFIMSDAFLPELLRNKLGLVDNSRRLARDVLTLMTLVHSKDSLTLLASSASISGDPLRPSPLLFACPAAVAAERIQRFYSPKAPSEAISATLKSPAAPFPFNPNTGPLKEVHVSPSAFDTYLACPYRFYLAHILKLETTGDSQHELESAQFGTLIHALMQDFAESPCVGSQSESEITDFLLSALERRFQTTFGTHYMPALYLQRKQLERRLLIFASQQAEHRADGWRIVKSEFNWPASESVIKLSSQTPLYMRGRIDRLDKHEKSGELYVIDYKTGRGKLDPKKNHLRSNEWISLQLPLYRGLIQRLHPGIQVKAGYFALGAKSEESGIREFEIDEALQKDAEAKAAQIAECIAQGIFWPPNDKALGRGFNRICEEARWESR